MPILITGGARSGKSGFAEKIAARMGSRGVYVATAQLYDEEMRAKARQHQIDRETGGFVWDTVEEPFEVAQLLDSLSGKGCIVLVDCLTLWLTNWLLRFENDPLQLEQQQKRLEEAVASFDGKLLLVTNEVGGGIVPEYPLGRRFRDAAGRLNQRLAARCDRVFLVTAGIPIELKEQAFRLEDSEF